MTHDCAAVNQQLQQSRISSMAIACENAVNMPKRTATPRGFVSSTKAAASRAAENTCPLTDVSLIACSLKLFSWQKFVSALWG